MKNYIIRKKNLSQKEILPDFFNLRKNNEKHLLSKLRSSIKQDKNKSKNIRLRNTINDNINNYYKSKTLNQKEVIKKKLKSNINLSKEYNNFCRSFLYPDYNFVSGKKILNALKSNGAEKTVNKYFSKIIPKANHIKHSNIFSITKNRNISTIKSKYLNLANKAYSNNSSLISANNKKSNKKFKTNLNNTICNNYNNKIVILYEYNTQKDNMKKKVKLLKQSHKTNTLLNKNFFCN